MRLNNTPATTLPKRIKSYVRSLKRTLWGWKVYAAIHPESGIWLPSIRTTENGVKKTFSDWNTHEEAGWKVIKIRIRSLKWI